MSWRHYVSKSSLFLNIAIDVRKEKLAFLNIAIDVRKEKLACGFKRSC